MKSLHPNAKILFYINGVLVSFLLLLSIGAMLSSFVFVIINELFGMQFAVMEIIGSLFVIILLSLTIPLIWSNLAYKNYKYQLENDKIIIEKGVIWKKYVTIPYNRIQNIDILRGPIARMLGLSDLQIQTAGSSTQIFIEGRLPGIEVSDAVKLKDQIISKVTGVKGSGL